MIGAGRQAGLRGRAAGNGARPLLLLRVLLALLLWTSTLAAFAHAADAAGRRWDAALAGQLMEAGALCAHDGTPDDAGADGAHHDCCDDCIACPCAGALLGPAPAPRPLGGRDGFVVRPPRVAVAHLVASLPFKRGPPPRAPPHLVITARLT